MSSENNKLLYLLHDIAITVILHLTALSVFFCYFGNDLDYIGYVTSAFEHRTEIHVDRTSYVSISLFSLFAQF